MILSRYILFLLVTFQVVNGWLAVSPIVNNAIDMFQLDNNGTKVKDILSIPVTAGEQTNGNAFSCGRCFCLLLTTNPKLKHSYLYNISFCLVPQPTLESKITLTGLAYNLHSERGEGDGGAGYLILIDHTQTPTQYVITYVNGKTITKLVDISSYVDRTSATTIYPGGTAYCADTGTMWISIQNNNNGKEDTLLMVNLQSQKILANVSLVNPSLTAHFASCGAVQRVGGVNQILNSQQQNIVQIGLLDITSGAFNVFDSQTLPSDKNNYQLSPIVEGIIMPQWENSYGSILYAKGDPFTLPGLLFVSYGGGTTNPPATFGSLAEAVTAVADEY